MPEIQILKSNESMVNSGKGMVRAGDLADRITRADVKSQLYRMEIISPTLSKHRLTTTLLSDYAIPSRYAGWSYAPPEWVSKADEEDFGHLMAISPPGPLTCRARGKILLLAAGKHAMTICLALETSIIGMPTSTYRKILREGLAQAPRVSKKGPKLPTFRIPPEMITPLSSKQDHSIRMVAAFVSEKWTWTVNDFTSLIRLHITSRGRPWSPNEIQPTNKEIWELLLKRYNSGPDLILEWNCASEKMDDWPEDDDDELTRLKLNPIRQELTQNRFLCFSGIGKYTANEILHELAIFPGTPSYFICCDDKRYEDFKEGIKCFVQQFSTKEYLARSSSVPNTANPLTFNEHLNVLYLRKYVKVYRRRRALVPRDLYNKQVFPQLKLDKGKPYICDQSMLLPENRKWKYVPVLRYHKPLAAYTIITAKIPPEWGFFAEPSYVRTDINDFGYATTIGPAQFRVQLLNRPNFRNITPGFFKPGRPKTEHTGKPGRPRKGLTRKRVKKLLAAQGGRSVKHLILGNQRPPTQMSLSRSLQIQSWSVVKRSEWSFAESQSCTSSLTLSKVVPISVHRERQRSTSSKPRFGFSSSARDQFVSLETP
ncbi:hypothetical protein CVT26_011508 [Gymnopilus dilepis]|uniref:Uncharacterized protein n=1 Tax=Gymnopilus dilepis TaxID=231916 RepID=A0A409WNH4_9AGAR|nr:hypothetical protein CVT26_011508 [Gymnopilus dilepis]